MDGSPGRRIPPAAAAAMIFILTFAADRAAVAQDAALRGGADLDARAPAIHRHVLTLDSHVDVIVPGARRRSPKSGAAISFAYSAKWRLSPAGCASPEEPPAGQLQPIMCL
jgi:hypothetical protein